MPAHQGRGDEREAGDHRDESRRRWIAGARRGQPGQHDGDGRIAEQGGALGQEEQGQSHLHGTQHGGMTLRQGNTPGDTVP